MPDSHPPTREKYPDHVEAERPRDPALPGRPDRRGAAELALFAPPHRRHRVAESAPAPGLDLDERHHAVALGDEVERLEEVQKLMR